MYLRYLQTPRLLISTIHVKLNMFEKVLQNTEITLIYKIFWKFDTFTPNVFYLYNHLKPMYEFKIRWHRYFDVPLYMIAAVTKNRHYVTWTCTKINVMHQIGFPVFNYSRCTTTNSLKTVSENSTLKFK
jgi:hypothetical protein